MNHRDINSKSVRAALRGRVDELPPAPAAAVKLLRLTSDDEANLSDISHVIETEPAIAAKVLQVVNSAYYGFPRNIRSIPRAVTLLGFSVVRQAALHLLVYEGMIKKGAKGAFDRLFFWQHSLLVAILSRGIGERVGHPDPDSLYTAGLLHDLGKVVLEAHGRVRYSDFVDACANSGNPNREDERNFFGVSHDAVGSFVSEHWGMPKLVCRVQALHHSPFLDKGLSEQEALEVAIVALADFIAWTQGIGSVKSQGSPCLSSDVRELVDPARMDLETLLEKADVEITEIGSFYGLKFPSSLQLRANMVSTAISLSQADGARDEQLPSREARVSHTAPHQSLDPDEFIPSTLEALQREFSISRLMMLQIDPQRRSLVGTHVVPATGGSDSREVTRELAIPTLSGDLVQCLRERHPVVISQTPENAHVLAQLGLNQGAAVPVMSRGRLLGLLWLDREPSEMPLGVVTLDEIQRVAGELGIALERSRTFAQERAKAELDALTRLHNRAAIDRFLVNSFRQATESGRVFALGLLDIDHFKRFNDTFGHQAGDDVLRIVADTLRNLTRPNDFLARYGGEEFLFILVNTAAQGAECYAERIREAIEQRGQLLKERFPGHALTASVGIAIFEPSMAGPDQLIGLADKALYRAKNSGRNCVVPSWLPKGAV